MKQELDFWEAIARSEADDDSACWMYADWLEEQGQPKGEFVRAQCRLEHLPPWSPERRDLTQLCQQLLADNAAQWMGEFASFDYDEIRFRRGVPSDVSIAAPNFLAQADSLLELAPTIRRVKLTAASEYLDALAESSLWNHFTHVDLSGNAIGDHGLERVLQAEGRDTVELLEFGSNDLTSAAIERLLVCPFARRSVWSLPFNKLTEDAGYLLRDYSQEHSCGLKGIACRGNGLGDNGFAALVEAELPELARLDVRDTRLTSAAVRALVEAPNRLGKLTQLDLRENSLQADGARVLSEAPAIRSVTDLQLRNNGIRSVGAQALASAQLDSMAILTLGGNQLRDDCVESAMRIEGLRYLDLSDNLLSSEAASIALSVINETELECVDISGHHFSSRLERRLKDRTDARIRY